VLGTPIAKELKEAIQLAAKDRSFQPTVAAHGSFIKLFANLLVGGGASPDLAPDKTAPSRRS
jgi:hypothetical protein